MVKAIRKLSLIQKRSAATLAALLKPNSDRLF